MDGLGKSELVYTMSFFVYVRLNIVSLNRQEKMVSLGGEKSEQEASSLLYAVGFFVVRLSDVHLEDNRAVQENKRQTLTVTTTAL